jgi:putative NADH-flavin reductase
MKENIREREPGNITIFGGTGNAGKIVVEKLLSTGKIVKVLTRTPSVGPEQRNLRFITGDVLQVTDMQKCIGVDDSVIITLGFNNSSEDTMSRGTRNIIAVMAEKKCSRLICLSAHGAGESWNDMPDGFKEMVMNDPVLKASFKDHGIQEEIVKASSLSWTIVRPTEIVATPESGNFAVNSYHDGLTYQISKYDVAQFIVDELHQNNYVRQIAMITS